MLAVRDEVDRNDVRLFVANTAEASKLYLFEKDMTLFLGHLSDYHCARSFLTPEVPLGESSRASSVSTVSRPDASSNRYALRVLIVLNNSSHLVLQRLFGSR